MDQTTAISSNDHAIDPGASHGLGAFGAFLGALIGGLIGALVWGLVAYFTGYEHSHIAIGLGLIVGICAKLMAGGEPSSINGAIATGVAILAILAGKYLTIFLLLAQQPVVNLQDPTTIEVTDEDMIIGIAEELIVAREDQGEVIQYPEYKEGAPISESYPPEIFQQASDEWNTLADEEKAKRKEEHKEQVAFFISQLKVNQSLWGRLRATLEVDIFKMFQGSDYLFIGIAGLIAFGCAKGKPKEEQAQAA